MYYASIPQSTFGKNATMRDEPANLPQQNDESSLVAATQHAVQWARGWIAGVGVAPAPQGPIGTALRIRFGAHGMPRAAGVFFLHLDGKFSHLPHGMGHTDAILAALPEQQRARYGMTAGEDDTEESVFNLDKERIDSEPLRDAYKEGLMRARLLEAELYICHSDRGTTPAQEKAIADMIAAHGIRQFAWDIVSGSGIVTGGNGIVAWKQFIHSS